MRKKESSARPLSIQLQTHYPISPLWQLEALRLAIYAHNQRRINQHKPRFHIRVIDIADIHSQLNDAFISYMTRGLGRCQMIIRSKEHYFTLDIDFKLKTALILDGSNSYKLTRLLPVLQDNGLNALVLGNESIILKNKCYSSVMALDHAVQLADMPDAHPLLFSKQYPNVKGWPVVDWLDTPFNLIKNSDSPLFLAKYQEKYSDKAPVILPDGRTLFQHVEQCRPQTPEAALIARHTHYCALAKHRLNRLNSAALKKVIEPIYIKRQQLITHLKDYMQSREYLRQRRTQGYLSAWLYKMFGTNLSVKIQAAQKIIHLLEGNAVILSREERHAIQDGELNRLYKHYREVTPLWRSAVSTTNNHRFFKQRDVSQESIYKPSITDRKSLAKK